MTEEKIKMDEIIKSLFDVSNKAIIGVINECFNETYDPQQVTIEKMDPNFIIPNKGYATIRADLILKINDLRYHIEFQTKNDTSMEIRMLEYGFFQAKESLERIDDVINVYYPRQAVIFIEENENINDNLKINVIFPDGQHVYYKIPTMRLWEYDIDQLIERKIYNLLPLILFTHRKELKRIKPEDLNAVRNVEETILEEIQLIGHYINALKEQKLLEDEDIDKIYAAVSNLIEYLNTKFIHDEQFGEEVIKMTKTLYDPLVEQRGIQKGIEQGIEQATSEMIIKLLDLVDDEILSNKTGVSLEKIKQLRKEHERLVH